MKIEKDRYPLPAEIKIGIEASLAGGRQAGAYLEEIGKGDVFNNITADEWRAFCISLVSGALIHALREVYSDSVPV